MVLYGTTPDALAQQQRSYDSLYGSANQANADALTQANNRQVQLQLAAQDNARRAAEQQNEFACNEHTGDGNGQRNP